MATVFLLKNNWNLERAVPAYYSSNPRSLPKESSALELLNIFDNYKDPYLDLILIDGTLSYLEDLGIDPEDCKSLTLAYLLNSPQTGEFHRRDFVDTWALAGVTSVSEMKQYVETKHQELATTPTEFVKLYNFVFSFVKGPDRGVRVIEGSEAISYWRLLFAQCSYLYNCSERLEQWYQFVEQSKRGVSKDLWEMFFKFLVDVLSTDPLLLSSYEEMSAWHSMLDEFVEWLLENNLLLRPK